MSKFKRLHRLQSETPDEGGTDVVDKDRPDDDFDEQDRASSENQYFKGDEGFEEITGEGDATEPKGIIQPVEEDELVVTIDGQEEAEEESSAPSWVKELRRKNREDQKRLRELEAENQRLKGVAPVDQAPKKPKLEDFDYDADAFEKAMDDYYAKKAKHDAELEKQAQAREAQEREWKERQQTYVKSKERFKPDAMKEAEDEVIANLSPARQAMIIDVADDPGTLVYALGKNSAKLRELASIKSDGRFIKELAKLEMNIKVQPKKTPPPPERTITGSGRSPGSAAANLDALREEAERTGDYTKYYNEKRRLGK